MLSKPNAESSGGSNARTSTSRSRRSRIAFAYSARFKRRSAGAPGFSGGGCIERRGEPGRERVVRRRLRPQRVLRRHRASAQLADDALPKLGVLVHGLGIEVGHREAAAEFRPVMAIGTVALERCLGVRCRAHDPGVITAQQAAASSAQAKGAARNDKFASEEERMHWNHSSQRVDACPGHWHHPREEPGTDTNRLFQFQFLRNPESGQ